MLLEVLILVADLLDELAAHGAHTTDDEVQLLILGEEEGVVEHVHGLSEALTFHDEGDVGL